MSKLAIPDTSACFYTFFNCRGELNCIEISTKRSMFSEIKMPTIIGGFEDSTIKCWNWNKPPNEFDKKRTRDMMEDNEKSIGYTTLIGHSGPVYGLSLNSDNKWLLSCSEDCTARLWNIESGTNVVVYKGHQYAVWDVSFSKFDYLFATASHDRTARLWTTDRISPVRILAGHLSDVEVFLKFKLII